MCASWPVCVCRPNGYQRIDLIVMPKPRVFTHEKQNWPGAVLPARRGTRMPKKNHWGKTQEQRSSAYAIVFRFSGCVVLLWNELEHLVNTCNGKQDHEVTLPHDM